MNWFRIIFFLLLGGLLAAVFHYTLPQRDLARITATEIVLTDFNRWNRMFYAQGDAGGPEVSSRDVRFINTVQDDGDVMVYRNEDTGFGWPPYFKLDSADVHAEATDLVSSADDPQWVVISHYGWRLNFPTIYPNVLSVQPVDDPNITLIPWPTIGVLVALLLIAFFAWRAWERFEDRVVHPTADWFAVRWAKTRDWMAGRR